ncbi:MAG: hypothetical protein C4532_19250 [Candidatus Abyssobacteria bacterium SURF_17]|uniref:Uncharacterized protein n=1 Tax=Candidatus Abyssobacteria bacterium SURF_17 TaxID=2093361 RepID=A0A419ENU1_9BACT|nr:MAG: hypothetical protein C4532_19250 [Candidatus Abyssubacteria bacterium SURF_17]
MGYYVFQNRADGWVEVHYADCPHCNHGFARPEGTDPARSEWLGPFTSYLTAESAAKETRAHVKDCENCGL